MRLTPAGKILLFLVGLGVLGYAAWTYRGRMPSLSTQRETPAASPSSSTPAARPSAPASERKGVLASVRQSGVLRVGMEPDAPPIRFINDRKQDDGFDFRVAGLIADGIGAKRVQIVEADYEDLPDRLRAGDIDIIMGGYVPDPSIDGVVWSNGYLDFGLCLIVQEGMAATFRSVRDLAGKRVAIYDDPSAERWVTQNIPGARISKFSGDNGWFEAVERDQADALVYDYPFAAEEIKAHPRTTIVQYNLNQSKYAVGVPAGNFDLVYEINQVIDKFRASPQIRRSDARVPDHRLGCVHPTRGRTQDLHGEGRRYAEPGGPGPARRFEPLARDLGSEQGARRVANENLIYPRLVLLMP